MSVLSIRFLAAFTIVLTLFTTLRMATAYSRDQLLSLRNSGVLLNHDVCLEVSQLRLRRRGCRAGAHHRHRVQVAQSVTSSVSRPLKPGEIPVIIGYRTVFTNNHQLFRRRHNSRPYYARSSGSSVSQSAVVRLDEHIETSTTTSLSPGTKSMTEPFLCPPPSTFCPVTSEQTVSWSIDTDCAAQSHISLTSSALS